MRLLIIILFLHSIITSVEHQYPTGWDELQSDEGWELIKETERRKIFKKQLSVSPLPAYKAELINSLDINLMMDVAWLVEKSTEIFPNAFIIDAGIYYNNTDNSYSAYQIFDIPFLTPRLYQFNSIRNNSSIHWTKTDTLDNIFNPDNLLIPPVNFGSWEAEIRGGETKLTYRICTDPGGDVPIWLIEQANQRYLPRMLLDLEQFVLQKID